MLITGPEASVKVGCYRYQPVFKVHIKDDFGIVPLAVVEQKLDLGPKLAPFASAAATISTVKVCQI